MPPDDTAIPVDLARTVGTRRGQPVRRRCRPARRPTTSRHWFDLETIVELPAPVASFADAADAAAQYRRASRAENTRRAYRAAVARFCDWCAVHDQTALPASPETVAAFLAAEARNELAVNTLRLRHAAIRYLHLLGRLPAADRGGRGRRPPLPASNAPIAGRSARRPRWCSTDCVAAIQAIPETFPGLRDRALLLVGFAAALRPSEIAGLVLEHLTHHADGIELFLPWRKNDQDAHGTKLWLPQGRTELCPVTALDDLARRRGDHRGAAVPADLAAAAAARRQGCHSQSVHRRATASAPTRSTPMRSR